MIGASALVLASPALQVASANAAVTTKSTALTSGSISATAIYKAVRFGRAAQAPTRAARPKLPAHHVVTMPYRFGSISYNRWYAAAYMQTHYRWGATQFGCLSEMWTRESGWSQYAHNWSSGAHGIPQAQPGYKMAAAGPDWQTDPRTQIRWGLSYIQTTYGTPCNAWDFWQWHNWY